MTVNYQSPNPVIIQFPRYAGGKFISNCLALSRHAVPQDRTAAEYLLQRPTDYNYRFQRVKQTLPTKEQMTDWIDKFEMGDRQLFGTSFLGWEETGTESANSITDRLSNSNLAFFITNHTGPTGVLNILKVWPCARIIQLINYREFFSISSQLKSTQKQSIVQHAGNYCEESYDMLRGPSWPTWQQVESVGYNVDLLDCQQHLKKELAQYYEWNQITNPVIRFNVDENIFDVFKFLPAVEQLYQQLGFDDFNSELVEAFWVSYIKLHR
jgi:arsenate reductase-like glutaredoxin family protein